MAAHNNHGPSIPHGSMSDYVVGLIWSLVLTVISFGVVMFGDFDRVTSIALIVIAGTTQVIAQLVYFLHMSRSEDQSWNIITAIFTVIQVLILVVGTVWIMMHLYMNMQIGF